MGCYCTDYFRSLQMTPNFHVAILQFCVELDLCYTSYIVFGLFFFYFRKQFSLFLNGCTFMFLLTEMRHLIFYLPFWSHILHLIHSQNKNECETLSTDFIFFLIFKTCKKNIRKLQNPVWVENLIIYKIYRKHLLYIYIYTFSI